MEVIQVAVPPGVMPPAPPAVSPKDPGVPAFPTQPRPMTPVVPAAPVTPTPPPEAPPTDPLAQLAAEAAKAAKPDATPPANPEAVTAADLGDIQDPVLRGVASSFLAVGGVDGVDIERALGVAMERGDASLIDKAYLLEKSPKHAEALATMAKALVEGMVAQANAMTASVYALAGDKSQWDAATAAFNTSAPESFRVVVKAMLDSADPKQIQAAAAEVVKFAKGEGHIVTKGETIKPSAGVPGPQGMSADEFRAEVGKLVTSSRDYDSKLQALVAQRKAGKALNK